MKKTNQLEEAMRAKIGPLKPAKTRASLFDTNPTQTITTAPEAVENKAGAVSAKSKKAQSISYKNAHSKGGEKIGAVSSEKPATNEIKARHNLVLSADLYGTLKNIEHKIKYNGNKTSGVNLNTLMESLLAVVNDISIDTGSVTDAASLRAVLKTAINQGRGEA